MLLTLLAQLLIGIVTGFSVHLFSLNQKAVTRKYFLYHGIGVLALLVPFFWMEGTTSALSLAAVVVNASILAEKRTFFSRSVFAIAMLVGTFLLWGMHLPILSFVSVVWSSLILGLALGAMCLGHWYLNQPKLSISELKTAVLLLLVLVVLRTIFAAVLVFDRELTLHFLMTTTPGLFLLMRVAWGLIAPLCMAPFLWNTVKLSSTQSATGILYVLVVMHLIGEIVSLYLVNNFGVVT